MNKEDLTEWIIHHITDVNHQHILLQLLVDDDTIASLNDVIDCANAEGYDDRMDDDYDDYDDYDEDE